MLPEYIKDFIYHALFIQRVGQMPMLSLYLMILYSPSYLVIMNWQMRKKEDDQNLFLIALTGFLFLAGWGSLLINFLFY